jgi:hypothetical protein
VLGDADRQALVDPERGPDELRAQVQRREREQAKADRRAGDRRRARGKERQRAKAGGYGCHRREG